MRLTLLAIGKKLPDWIVKGILEYQQRFPKHSPLEIIELSEQSKMYAALPLKSQIIALCIEGKAWSSEALALQWERWQHSGQDLTFLIGGPNGLSADCLERAQERWSLSTLTLPHTIARLVVVEQLYRAWTIVSRHPYHLGHL